MIELNLIMDVNVLLLWSMFVCICKRYVVVSAFFNL